MVEVDERTSSIGPAGVMAMAWYVQKKTKSLMCSVEGRPTSGKVRAL